MRKGRAPASQPGFCQVNREGTGRGHGGADSPAGDRGGARAPSLGARFVRRLDSFVTTERRTDALSAAQAFRVLQVMSGSLKQAQPRNTKGNKSRMNTEDTDVGFTEGKEARI